MSVGVAQRFGSRVPIPSGGLYIETAAVSDNAHAHFGDNIYNYHNAPDIRQRKLDLLLESLTFNRMGARERNVADAISDTCDWLFEDDEFHAWVNNDKIAEHHGFFWIKGKPGTGKSTLLKKTISWAKNRWPDDIVLSYFFNGRSPNVLEHTATGVYRTLLHQLLMSLPHCHDTFLSNFAAKEQYGKVDAWEEIELQNFFLDCISSNSTDSLLIFIDAMDEGHDDDVERMVFFLDHLASRTIAVGIQLRLCLSSRHYPHIEIPHSISIVLEHKPGHINDIETYVRSSLSLTGASIDDLRHILVQRSEGVFLWVVLVIPLLKTVHRKGKGVGAMMKVLENVPRDLHELFASLLSRDPNDFDECITLLRWVLYSFESLTPAMLYAAVAQAHPSVLEDDIQPESGHQERYLLNTSRGLIELVEEFDDFSDADSDEGNNWLTDPVLQTEQFIHQTVIDYLTGTYKDTSIVATRESQQPTIGPFVADQSHADIARTCLQYLIRLSEATQLTADVLNRWHLAPYAAKFWWKHMDMSGSACDQSLTTLAANFLIGEKSRQLWVQLYDLNYPAELNSAKISQWGRQVLKTPACFQYRPGPLCLAVMLGLPKVVETIMISDSATDVWNETWGDALQVACSQGYWDLAQFLLSLGANPNTRLGHRHRGSPLQLASLFGRETLVELLLHHGADVNASVGRLATPLQEAARWGHHGIVQKLIDAGADLDRDSAVGDNALIRAFEFGHDSVVQTLLSAGASVSLEWYHKWPSILQALLDGRAGTVKALVGEGLPIDHVLFNSALVTAFTQQDHRGLNALLDAGPEVVGTAWNHSLVIACAAGLDKLVYLLLVSDADLNHRSIEDGLTALAAACANGHLTIAQMLLNKGADADYSAAKQSPLSHAANKGHLEIVQLLLSAGANPDVTTEGQTPLLVAARHANVEVVRVLLASGADPNLWHPSNSGPSATPLIEASSQGHEDVVQLLLDAGAEVNMRISTGHGQRTALVEAAVANHHLIIARLLEAGANVYVADLCERRHPGYSSDGLERRYSLQEAMNYQCMLHLVSNSPVPTRSRILKRLFQEATEHAISILDTDTAPLQFLMERVDCVAILNSETEEWLWPSPCVRAKGPDIRVKLSWSWNISTAEMHSARTNMMRALYDAATRGYVEVVKLIIGYRIETNGEGNGKFSEALFSAARHFHTEIVRRLLESGGFLVATEICRLTEEFGKSSPNKYKIPWLWETDITRFLETKADVHEGLEYLRPRYSTAQYDIVRLLLLALRREVESQKE